MRHHCGGQWHSRVCHKANTNNIANICEQAFAPEHARKRIHQNTTIRNKELLQKALNGAPKSGCNCHRSHFGSRCKLGCCGHAGLFAAWFDSWLAHGVQFHDFTLAGFGPTRSYALHLAWEISGALFVWMLIPLFSAPTSKTKCPMWKLVRF